MIKLADIDSNEYRIAHDLLRCGELYNGKLSGLVAPLAILDSPHSFVFIVMPRQVYRHL